MPDHNVTLKDIAARCGVDVSTVSRALRGNSRYSKQTVEHIQAIAKEMGYDPAEHLDARRLALRRYGRGEINHIIAFFLPVQFYYSHYTIEIYQGVVDALSHAGFGLVTFHRRPETLEPEKLPSAFTSGSIDALIVAEMPSIFAPALGRLRAMPGFGDRPVAYVLRNVVPDCTSILAATEDGAYTAARHLLELGHRHLLYFVRSRHLAFEAHQDTFPAGYARACRDYGLDPEKHLHPYEIGRNLFTMTFTMTNHWKLPYIEKQTFSVQHSLTQTVLRHGVTGILAANDATAIVTRQILRCGGVRVPEDVSIVGYDDTDMMMDDRGEKNMLTTIHVPLHEAGRRAATEVISQIKGESPKNTQIVLPTSLVVRSSTQSV